MWVRSPAPVNCSGLVLSPQSMVYSPEAAATGMVICWLAESVFQVVVKGALSQSRLGSSGTSVMVSSRQWVVADEWPGSWTVAVMFAV